MKFFQLLLESLVASLRTAQDGTSGYDQFDAITVTEDNCLVLAGSSTGSWIGENAGGPDFVAIKLRLDHSFLGMHRTEDSCSPPTCCSRTPHSFSRMCTELSHPLEQF